VVEEDGASAASASDPSALITQGMSELTEGQHGYSLRPRPQRNYKE
jgi:hypothetical protein